MGATGEWVRMYPSPPHMLLLQLQYKRVLLRLMQGGCMIWPLPHAVSPICLGVPGCPSSSQG